MKKFKILLAAIVAILGLVMTIEGYKMSRPEYYLTISGSSPDDYTAAGYMLLVVGASMVVVSVFLFVHKTRNNNH